MGTTSKAQREPPWSLHSFRNNTNAASTPRQGLGRDAGRDQPAGTTALIGQLISTIFFNIDILGRMQLPFLADPGTGRSWYDRADPEEWRVSSPDATMTAAGAAESVGGGEAVGMPSLRQAASGPAAAPSQGPTGGPGGGPPGPGPTPKRASDPGGMGRAGGARISAHDVRHNGAMPSMIEPGAFEVGRDLAVTPGAVVARDSVAELIQYSPATPEVFQRPVLVVPPPIGRFYFLDLRPGRSFVEYAARRGLQTFMLSWRNPTAEQGQWDLQTYAQTVSSAVDAVREITGSPDVNLIGFCAGGIIATTLLSHLAAVGDHRVHSMSYAVTLLDFGLRAPITAFSA